MSQDDVMQRALKNCLGWAGGIHESSKDEASRKVAGWIVERCQDALAFVPSTTRRSDGVQPFDGWKLYCELFEDAFKRKPKLEDDASPIVLDMMLQKLRLPSAMAPITHRLPDGWNIWRTAHIVETFGVKSPEGHVAFVSAADRNPALVLFMLAKVMCTADGGKQTDG